MRVIGQLKDLASVQCPIILAAGAFDGVHKGHQKVVSDALAEAESQKGEAWVLTFDPHPLKLLHPARAPSLLTSTAHKLQLLAKLGIHGCAVIPFTREFSNVEPEAFVEQLCAAAPTLSEIVVGENWKFGHRARGNAELLKQLAPRFRFRIKALPRMTWQGKPISSTRIRQAINRGHLDDAARMMGRPFSILGTVMEGKKLGRKLGFPTANIDPHNEVRPPPGIYAAYVMLDGIRYPSAAYLAAHVRETSEPDMVEVHLLDQALDLYGKDIEVFFSKKVRDDRPFPDLQTLAHQIQQDIVEIRKWLATGQPMD